MGRKSKKKVQWRRLSLNDSTIQCHEDTNFSSDFYETLSRSPTPHCEQDYPQDNSELVNPRARRPFYNNDRRYCNNYDFPKGFERSDSVERDYRNTYKLNHTNSFPHNHHRSYRDAIHSGDKRKNFRHFPRQGFLKGDLHGGIKRRWSEEDPQTIEYYADALELDPCEEGAERPTQPVHTILVGNDEYTKIQTPRQEVMFRKNFLDRKRDSSDDNFSVTSTAGGDLGSLGDSLEDSLSTSEELNPEAHTDAAIYEDPNYIFAGEPGKPPLAGVVMQQVYPGGPMISIPVHWTPFIDPSLIPGDTALTTLDPSFTHIIDPKSLPPDSAHILPVQHDANGSPVTVQVKLDANGVPVEIEPSTFTVSLSTLNQRQQETILQQTLIPFSNMISQEAEVTSSPESLAKDPSMTNLENNNSNILQEETSPPLHSEDSEKRESKDHEDNSSDSQYASMSEASTTPTTPAGELSFPSDNSQEMSLEADQDQNKENRIAIETKLCGGETEEQVCHEECLSRGDSVISSGTSEMDVEDSSIKTVCNLPTNDGEIFLATPVEDHSIENESAVLLSLDEQAAGDLALEVSSIEKHEECLEINISLTCQNNEHDVRTKDLADFMKSPEKEVDENTLNCHKNCHNLTDEDAADPMNNPEKELNEDTLNCHNDIHILTGEDITNSVKNHEKELDEDTLNCFSDSHVLTREDIANSLKNPEKELDKDTLNCHNINHDPTGENVTDSLKNPEKELNENTLNCHNNSRDLTGEDVTDSVKSPEKRLDEATLNCHSNNHDPTSEDVTDSVKNPEKELEDSPLDCQQKVSPRLDSLPKVLSEEANDSCKTLADESEGNYDILPTPLNELNCQDDIENTQCLVEEQMITDESEKDFSSSNSEEATDEKEKELATDEKEKDDSRVSKNESISKPGYIVVPILTPYYDPAVLYGYPLVMQDQPRHSDKPYSKSKRKKFKKHPENMHSTVILDTELYTGEPYMATPNGYLIPLESQQLCQVHGYQFNGPFSPIIPENDCVALEQHPFHNKDNVHKPPISPKRSPYHGGNNSNKKMHPPPPNTENSNQSDSNDLSDSGVSETEETLTSTEQNVSDSSDQQTLEQASSKNCTSSPSDVIVSHEVENRLSPFMSQETSNESPSRDSSAHSHAPTDAPLSNSRQSSEAKSHLNKDEAMTAMQTNKVKLTKSQKAEKNKKRKKSGPKAKNIIKENEPIECIDEEEDKMIVSNLAAPPSPSPSPPLIPVKRAKSTPETKTKTTSVSIEVKRPQTITQTKPETQKQTRQQKNTPVEEKSVKLEIKTAITQKEKTEEQLKSIPRLEKEESSISVKETKPQRLSPKEKQQTERIDEQKLTQPSNETPQKAKGATEQVNQQSTSRQREKQQQLVSSTEIAKNTSNTAKKEPSQSMNSKPGGDSVQTENQSKIPNNRKTRIGQNKKNKATPKHSDSIFPQISNKDILYDDIQKIQDQILPLLAKESVFIPKSSHSFFKAMQNFSHFSHTDDSPYKQITNNKIYISPHLEKEILHSKKENKHSQSQKDNLPNLDITDIDENKLTNIKTSPVGFGSINLELLETRVAMARKGSKDVPESSISSPEVQSEHKDRQNRKPKPRKKSKKETPASKEVEKQELTTSKSKKKAKKSSQNALCSPTTVQNEKQSERKENYTDHKLPVDIPTISDKNIEMKNSKLDYDTSSNSNSILDPKAESKEELCQDNVTLLTNGIDESNTAMNSTIHKNAIDEIAVRREEIECSSEEVKDSSSLNSTEETESCDASSTENMELSTEDEIHSNPTPLEDLSQAASSCEMIERDEEAGLGKDFNSAEESTDEVKELEITTNPEFLNEILHSEENIKLQNDEEPKEVEKRSRESSFAIEAIPINSSDELLQNLGVTEAVKRWIREVTPEKAFVMPNSNQLLTPVESEDEFIDDEIQIDEEEEFESLPKNVIGNPTAALPSKEGMGTCGTRVANQCQGFTLYSLLDDSDKMSSSSIMSRRQLYSESSYSLPVSAQMSFDDDDSTRDTTRYDPSIYSKYYHFGVEIDSPTPIPSSRAPSKDRDSSIVYESEGLEIDSMIPLPQETNTYSMSLATELYKAEKVKLDMLHICRDDSDADLPTPICGAVSDGNLTTANFASPMSSGIGSSLASTPTGTPKRKAQSNQDSELNSPFKSPNLVNGPLPCKTVCCSLM